MKKSRASIIDTIRSSLEKHSYQATGEHMELLNGDAVFTPASDPLEIEFAKNFSSVSGRFLYCSSWLEVEKGIVDVMHQHSLNNFFCNRQSIIKNLTNIQTEYKIIQHELSEDIQLSITDCKYLVARTGSIVYSNEGNRGRTASVYAPIHITIAFMDQIVWDLKDALSLIKSNFNVQNLASMITFISGPSRSADIEKTLVQGVHGSKEVYLFLIDSKQGITL